MFPDRALVDELPLLSFIAWFIITGFDVNTLVGKVLYAAVISLTDRSATPEHKEGTGSSLPSNTHITRQHCYGLQLPGNRSLSKR